MAKVSDALSRLGAMSFYEVGAAIVMEVHYQRDTQARVSRETMLEALRDLSLYVVCECGRPECVFMTRYFHRKAMH